jgi:hypothetical protein
MDSWMRLSMLSRCIDLFVYSFQLVSFLLFLFHHFVCFSFHLPIRSFLPFQAQKLTLLQTQLTQQVEKHLALTHTARQVRLERVGNLREDRYGFFVF